MAAGEHDATARLVRDADATKIHPVFDEPEHVRDADAAAIQGIFHATREHRLPATTPNATDAADATNATTRLDALQPNRNHAAADAIRAR